MKMKMRCWKQKDPKRPFAHMWLGECSCGYTTQYWSWGATLGALIFTHSRKCVLR